MAVTEVTSPPPERAESTASVLSELKKQSSDVNIIKEYKDMFSKEKSDKSDLATDQITDVGDAALDLLKTLINEAKKISSSKDNKKWEFETSPHKHFDKTLDDTYKAFLSWARVKQDTSKVNVSKAFRRLESYADWMDDTGTDLIEPPLTSSSIKKALDAWQFNSSINSDGQLVWWCDMGRVDIAKVKEEFTPEDHLRAFVWYTHALMYNESAQQNGMAFVYNVAKMGMIQSFTLMPAKLGAKLDKLTIGVLPIKMQNMYMFESPTWINIFMKLIGMFMSKKMKERMIFIKDWSTAETDKIGGLECFPKGFGRVNGTLEGNVIEDLYFGKE